MGKIDLISIKDKKSPIVEAYRTIRTNINFFSSNRKLKTILFTSSDAGEGKSTTVANLATVIGQTGQKVLVVDCDLRKSNQHHLFSLHNRGLTNCLVSGEPVDNFIQATEVEDVDVLTAGPIPPNPSELLGSEKMASLLNTVSEKYNYVLLDTPPVLPVTDAMVIATMADGIIMVVCAGMISPREAIDVKNRLQQSGTPILGVILNKVEYSHGYYKYKYKYRY